MRRFRSADCPDYPMTDAAARRRITASLFLSQAFYSSAYLGMFGVMPILAAQFGGSPVQAGLPLFITMAGRALASYPLGWAMDRFGRRTALTTGFTGGVLSAVMGMLAVWGSNFGLLLRPASSECRRFRARGSCREHAPGSGPGSRRSSCWRLRWCVPRVCCGLIR